MAEMENRLHREETALDEEIRLSQKKQIADLRREIAGIELCAPPPEFQDVRCLVPLFTVSHLYVPERWLKQLAGVTCDCAKYVLLQSVQHHALLLKEERNRRSILTQTPTKYGVINVPVKDTFPFDVRNLAVHRDRVSVAVPANMSLATVRRLRRVNKTKRLYETSSDEANLLTNPWRNQYRVKFGKCCFSIRQNSASERKEKPLPLSDMDSPIS